jgi:N-acetylmuramic acid 6-phosphate etherase
VPVTELDRTDVLGALLTEATRPELMQIDLASTDELVSLMNAEDASVPRAVAAAAPAIVRAIDAISERMARGGRLVYVGAGTAGRIGMLDAVECPPTFNSAPGQVVALLAGGDDAFRGATERAEDDVETAPGELDRLSIGPDDSVVGIAASGRTPYVLAGMLHARSRGALTVGLSCNPQSQLSDVVDHPIEVVVGAEFIAGSTRLKAGTAQKLVLNMISTITMVRLGKTLGNLMVDVQGTNEKLRARAVRIIAQASGVGEDAAASALVAAGGDTRVAIVALGRGVDSDEARRQLEAHGGDLRRALGAPR